MKIMLSVCFLVIFFKGYGQNNQIKLYIQQIAANKVYMEYLQKGYSIVKRGLNTIGEIKSGHFKLDINFFEGLENINPRVKDYKKVADIISLNMQIVKRTEKLITEVESNDLFSEREINYVISVVTALLANSLMLIEELASLLKKSELKMSDDERIRRVEGLYEQTRSNYAFINYFSGELQILQLQKSKELNDATVLKDLLKD